MRGDELQLVSLLAPGLLQHRIHRGVGALERADRIVTGQQIRQHQGADKIANPHRLAGKVIKRTGNQVIPLRGGQQHLEAAGVLRRTTEMLDQHQLDAAGQQLMGSRAGLIQISQMGITEGLQLQQVGGHHVGHRQRLLGQETGDAGGNDAPLLRVTHHRVAEVDGIGVGRLDGVDHGQDLVPLLGGAKVAAQHGVTVAQHLDIAQSFHQRTDMTRRHRHPLPPLGILGVVGKLHRVDGPYIHAEAAHGEDGRAVAGTTKDHVGLNRENGFHREYHSKGSARWAIYRMKITMRHLGAR